MNTLNERGWLLRRLESRKRQIAADLKARQSKTEIEMHPNLPDLYRRKVTRLQEALNDQAIRPQVIEIVRSLIERIEVNPCQARGRCEVIIVGALAQILAFTQKKTSATSMGGSGTFLMVAGARNQRCLHLDHAVL